MPAGAMSIKTWHRGGAALYERLLRAMIFIRVRLDDAQR